MKSSNRIFLISFLAAISLIICSCGDGDHSGHDHNDDVRGIIDPAHKLVSMRVQKVPCEDCVAKVEGVLKTDGIVKAQVFKDTERSQNVIVIFDPAKISLDDIKGLITKLGKTIANIVEN